MLNQVKISKKLTRRTVRQLFPDLPPESLDEFLPTFTYKLVDLAKFNNCEKIIIKRISPERIRNNIGVLVKNVFC